MLICYFGELPWYFEYFIHSCKLNPTIDFILITDSNRKMKNLPDNFTIIKKTLKEIKQNGKKKLGFGICIDEPYKLCDFKPVYGYLFPEIINGYDFWGHGDIDVIFGNIRNFVTDKILEDHDLICVRHDFLSGYFTLFRNAKKMNELFKHSKDYKKVLTSCRHFCFDETNFAFDQFTDAVPLHEIKSEIESMTHVVKRLHQKKIVNAYFDFHVIEGLPGRLKWQRGL